jgi:hypothetical protein
MEADRRVPLSFAPVQRPSAYFLQEASAASLADPLGTAEVLTTSSHTSRAAVLTAEVSPLAAFSQAPSSFFFAPSGSLVCDWMICLHSSVAALTSLEPVDGVVEVVEVVDVEEVVAGVDWVAAGVELLVVVEELELLPHAEISSAQSASAASNGRYRLRFIGPPGID